MDYEQIYSKYINSSEPTHRMKIAMLHMMNTPYYDRDAGETMMREIGPEEPAAYFHMFAMKTIEGDYDAAFEYFKLFDPEFIKSMGSRPTSLLVRTILEHREFELERLFMYEKASDPYNTCDSCNAEMRTGFFCPHAFLNNRDKKYLRILKLRRKTCDICFEKNLVKAKATYSPYKISPDYTKCSQCKNRICTDCGKKINKCPFCRGPDLRHYTEL